MSPLIESLQHSMNLKFKEGCQCLLVYLLPGSDEKHYRQLIRL
eukprot:gene11935-8215_t